MRVINISGERSPEEVIEDELRGVDPDAPLPITPQKTATLGEQFRALGSGLVSLIGTLIGLAIIIGLGVLAFSTAPWWALVIIVLLVLLLLK